MEDDQCKQIGDYYYRLSSKPIGKGSFATVYKGSRMNDDNDVVAIKVINSQTLMQYEDFSEMFDREIDILIELKGKHLLDVKKIMKSKSGNIYIVTSYCNGGSLEQLLSKEGKLSESQGLKILKEISEAFTEIEKIGLKNKNGEKMMFMHRDIKPANILFHDGETKLADFGFAKLIEEGTKNIKQKHTMLGSPTYMAPQILKQEEYSYKCDIWSMGVVLFEMITGRVPWYSSSTYELSQNIMRVPLDIPKLISEECRDLLKSMLAIEETNRIEWKDILKHPAIAGKKNSKEVPEPYEEVLSKKMMEVSKSNNIVDNFQSFEKNDKLKDSGQVKAEMESSGSKSNRIKILSMSSTNEEAPKTEKKKSKIKILD